MSARIESAFRQNRAMKCHYCGKRTRKRGLTPHVQAKHRDEMRAARAATSAEGGTK